MTKTEFNKLTIENRLTLLREKGTFIGSKKHESYFVHLFTLDRLYIEMWRTISTNQIQWIEITENLDGLSEYVKDVKIP